MKRIPAILMCLALMVMPLTHADAQIKGLKERMKEKLSKTLETPEEEKAEPEPEPETEPAPRPASPAEKLMQERMMAAMGMNANIPHEKNYQFSSSMSMKINNFKAETQQDEEVLYTLHYDRNHPNYAMVFNAVNQESNRPQKTMMIFDMKNRSMLILTDDGQERSGMIMPFETDAEGYGETHEPAGEVSEEEAEATMEDLEWYYRKTGKSRTIAGLRCDEYVHSDSLGTATIWAAPSKQVDYSKAWGHMGGMQYLATGWFGQGMVMASRFVDATTRDRTEMEVTEIRENSPGSLDISGYRLMGFGGGKK